ncbi:methyltransferase domain-containing protein [Streptomyces sp. SID4919]|uniref:class I SAM-dependent methyltransferase n=1 Tax=unclassified Streptomyces TaxID=2593676 RepID=UPI000823E497|nr:MULTISPECIES: class I SAM-dependent methyltransferase [unclassified Streptomyces]MYY13493.1 methyltransferase domain-containing protein [Streptomyces sp. SID4919]SCK63132.1 Methylase involved in ubiquinone/menaquinone biosynthesis [Streptomyces sp. AmelKG-E11A]
MNPTIPTTPGIHPIHTGQRSAPYDAFHTARTHSDLVSRLYAQALGEDYPTETAASSSCDIPLLGLMTARLRMRPGQLLVDAGCGTGGIGLWLTRALNLRLEGFDLSPAATAQATARRPRFGLPAGRATFRTADLEDTGLPDSHAQGIVCVDALGRATDRQAALRELARILAPGGRLVLTRASRQNTTPAWEEQARTVGLTVEHVDERPHEPAMWDRLYHLWIAHADELRHELGETQARNMLHEAHHTLPTLPGRRAVLLTLLRPEDVQSGTCVADTMSGPARRSGSGHEPRERTPQ